MFSDGVVDRAGQSQIGGVLCILITGQQPQKQRAVARLAVLAVVEWGVGDFVQVDHGGDFSW